MKLVQSRYLHLTLDPNKSEWSFSIPHGTLQILNKDDVYKIYIKKLIFRNDFPVITSANNMLKYSGEDYTIRTGSPNSLLLARELSTLHPDIEWFFDAYDGKMYIKNKSTDTDYLLEPTGIHKLIGQPLNVVLWRNSTVACAKSVDLAPPETIIFRMSDLSSSTLDLEENDTRTNNVLAYVGVDQVPYQTCVYVDSAGQFGHFLQRKNIDSIKLTLENSSGISIASVTPMTMILCVETWRNDEGKILDMMYEQVQLQRLALIGDDLKNEKKRSTLVG